MTKSENYSIRHILQTMIFKTATLRTKSHSIGFDIIFPQTVAAIILPVIHVHVAFSASLPP